MGSELVTTAFPTNKKVGGVNNSAHISIMDIFDKAIPYYLSIGMSIDEFWHGDCENARYYREADKIKRHRKNEEMWLQGAYIYNAIGSLAPILRFSMKPQPPLPYMDKPLDLEPKEDSVPVEDKEKSAYEHGIASMRAWANKINKTKGGAEDGCKSADR